MRSPLSQFMRILPGDGLRESVILSGIYRCCQSERVSRWCLTQALRHETPFFSLTARRILLERHNISVGAYSYGPCFDPGSFGAGTVIGRYVSIAQRVRAYQANHPMDRVSTHAFFFNSALGYIPKTNIPMTNLVIEHDAWIGDGVIITPRCRRIGLGAVIGAGSVVTKDVPDFVVVAGNPARVIRSRFSEKIQDIVRCSKWWLLPVAECVKHISFFAESLQTDAANHPLLTPR